MAFLLWLTLLLASPNYFLRIDVIPRFQGSDVTGHAQKPVVVSVRAKAECRQIGVVIDGDNYQRSTVRENPVDRTLRVELGEHIPTGVYNVIVACLDHEEGVLQAVNAGTVEVS